MIKKFYKNKIIIILLVNLISINFQISAVNKQDDGVILSLKKQKDTDPQLINVQVCTDEIIRVITLPEKSFSDRKSLMVEKTNWDTVPWTMKENDNEVEIITTKLIVKINRENGAITFLDNNGKIILKEKEDKGKIITPAKVMGELTYHIQQLFYLNDEEAFYGLGQHQNGVMNYNGHDVDLWQYNTVAAVPFLVSNKNYGILWDNNSRTKFGDIRDFQSISSLRLFNKEGIKGGLTAEYFKDTSFNSLFISQNESKIEHEFLDVNDKFPDGFEENVSTVRWSGEIESNKSGLHKFRLYSSGYIKMWLNDELVVNSWRQNWLPWTHILKLNMETGKRYKIKIEWIHSGGYIGLKYLEPENEKAKKIISLYSEVADQIDYYFIHGANLDQIISGYRKITGKAVMMPKWAFGLWQCRERYKSQYELLSVVKEFRKRKIPIDNIVQDWFYWEEDKWGDHEFDSSRFPDPEAMIEELHNDLNTHIMISVWPKFYVGTKNYEAFKKNGWLYMRNIEKGQKDWVGPGYVSTFYDTYNPDASKLFWQQINEKLFSKGIDAWWLDATEPDIHSNLSHKEWRLRIGPTALGTSARYFNTYSLMNSKAVYEGQKKVNPDKRVFILTRSAYAGQQRYSTATWSGDVASRWEDLKNQVSAGLNFCLSGIPYWTSDIGGFAVETRYENPDSADLDEWRELNTRWFQFGTFCPLFRVHGQYPYREIFNIAPEEHSAYKSMLAYNKLRYRLMPYIYSLSGMVTQNDYTIMRALIMDFPNDKNVFNIDDQFMFGPALLVNPVTNYKSRTRNVYLPSGTGWYDFHSGEYFEGGRTITAEAPYSDIPIFVKEGSIILYGPEIQYATEKAADPIRLIVCTGKDGSFSLYEDENINFNYEQGKFSVIDFIYNENNQTLTIGDRKGEFKGMMKERTFEIVWVRKDKSSKINFNSKPDMVVKYNGRKQIIETNPL